MERIFISISIFLRQYRQMLPTDTIAQKSSIQTFSIHVLDGIWNGIACNRKRKINEKSKHDILWQLFAPWRVHSRVEKMH